MTFWYNTDPAIFIIDLKDANKIVKKLIFLKRFSAYYFVKVHLHHFSRIKSENEVTKQMYPDLDPGGPKEIRIRQIRIRNTGIFLTGL
jgi:hypothetical protein